MTNALLWGLLILNLPYALVGWVVVIGVFSTVIPTVFSFLWKKVIAPLLAVTSIAVCGLGIGSFYYHKLWDVPHANTVSSALLIIALYEAVKARLRKWEVSKFPSKLRTFEKQRPLPWSKEDIQKFLKKTVGDDAPAKHGKCSHCGEALVEGYETGASGNCYCRSCWQNFFQRSCAKCGKTCGLVDSLYNSSCGAFLCLNCNGVNVTTFYTCEGCDNKFSGKPEELDGHKLCATCFRKRQRLLNECYGESVNEPKEHEPKEGTDNGREIEVPAPV